MRKPALIGGWVVVVALATTTTWQVVGAVDDQVSARPVSPLNVSAPLAAAAPSTTVEPGLSPSSLISPSTSLPVISPSTTTGPAAPAPPTTNSTLSPGEWQTRSTATSGGTVVVRYRPGEVVIETATPAAGFRAEIEKPGPPSVEVEFESDQLRVEIRLGWEDGDLDVEIRESGEEG